MEMADRERSNESFNKWYGTHAETFNASRKERYANDPELRARARAAAKAYRDKQAEGRTDLPPLRAGLATSSRVALIIGITRQTLMNWEERGLIPKPTTRGKHRLYTENQVDLLDSLYAAMRAGDDVESAKTELWATWNIDHE